MTTEPATDDHRQASMVYFLPGLGLVVQLKDLGPSRTYNESKEEEKEVVQILPHGVELFWQDLVVLDN